MTLNQNLNELNQASLIRNFSSRLKNIVLSTECAFVATHASNFANLHLVKILQFLNKDVIRKGSIYSTESAHLNTNG